MDAYKLISHSMKKKNVSIDNWIFKLNYKATGLLFGVLAIIVGTTQIFGAAINCTTRSVNAQTSPILDAYCWHQVYVITNPSASYNIPKYKYPGTLHPVNKDSIVKYITLYPWISIILGIHMLLHYGPHFFWKIWENETVKNSLCSEMKQDTVDQWIEKRSAITRKIMPKLGKMRGYGFKYFICEFLNVLCTLCSILFMEFYLAVPLFGLHVVGLKKHAGGLPVSHTTFPDIAKCTFQIIEGGGNLVDQDSLCVLGHSPFYFKMFGFLWWWLFVTFFLNCAQLSCRCLMTQMYYRIQLGKLATNVDKGIIKRVMKGNGFGDFCLLYGIGESLSSSEFSELLESIEQRMCDNV